MSLDDPRPGQILITKHSTMAVAKAFGARRIIAIDVQQTRLEFAKQFLGVEVHVAPPMETGEDRQTYSERHV